MKEEFDQMSIIYGAIQRVDVIVASNSDAKIDEALSAIKEINMKNFDTDSQEQIVLLIRRALQHMYANAMNEVNEKINIKAVPIDDGIAAKYIPERIKIENDKKEDNTNEGN